VTRYVDHFEHKGSLFIVMEYANGGDLYTKIQSRRGVRFSEKEVLHYFCQLAMALMHLHNKRILHRDLKAQNVFLTRDGIVKLGDFGISTVLRNTYELRRTVCGTPYYFSPELCQSKPYNNKSDVWALGCILYELTTLTHAFDGANMKALVQKILKGAYPPIHSSYSPELGALIGAMLNIMPERRPNVHELLQMPYIRNAMSAMQATIGGAIKDHKSCVDPTERAKELEAAKARVEAEQRKREELKVREEQRQRDELRIKVEREAQLRLAMREHEEKIRKQQEAERQRRADAVVADRARRAEEDKRLEADRAERARRQEAERRRIEEDRKRWEEEKRVRLAANAKREEDWERNMQDMREKAAARAQAAQAAAGFGGAAPRPGVLAPPGIDARAAAFNDARAAADANRRRAELEAAEARRRYELPPLERDARPPAPLAAKRLTPEEEERRRRDAFMQMKAEAEANRRRLAEQMQPSAAAAMDMGAPQPAHAPAPRANALPVGSPIDEQARRELFWQLRRDAEANKRRLLADDEPAPPPAPTPAAPAAAPAPAPVAPVTPPQPAMVREPTPPDAEGDDTDGTDGLHRFINNEAAAGEEEREVGAGREKEYTLLNDALQEALNAPLPTDADFEEAAAPGHFVLDGKELQLPRVTDASSLWTRIEALKVFLEDRLGFDAFIGLYRILQRMGENTESDDALLDNATQSLPKEKHALIPLITQLILCEEMDSKKSNSM
jgi:NIMA (never in mitosis gene a)-related kinase